MRAPGYLGCAALVVTLGGAEAGAQGRPLDLAGLVARLDLTEKGAKRWLEQLGVRGDSTATERLLAVSASSGASLLTREGGDSSVRIDPELDTLLLRPETGIVLVHNHPANVGLSSNDLRQLTKPGVLAVVAIGVMIAVPTTLSMIIALGTVIGSAVVVATMLARMVGD